MRRLLNNFHSYVSRTYDVNTSWDYTDVYAVALGDQECVTCGITDPNRGVHRKPIYNKRCSVIYETYRDAFLCDGLRAVVYSDSDLGVFLYGQDKESLIFGLCYRIPIYNPTIHTPLRVTLCIGEYDVGASCNVGATQIGFSICFYCYVISYFTGESICLLYTSCQDSS